MDFPTFVTTVTGPAIATVVGSLVGIVTGSVTAIVAARAVVKNNERKILIENVTQERAKWREKIRAQAVNVFKAVAKKDDIWLDELKLVFATSLNPQSKQDKLILQVIERLKNSNTSKIDLEEFTLRISLLLKHDWDRAKSEAKANNPEKTQRLTPEDIASGKYNKF
jgi:hypothetical protein